MLEISFDKLLDDNFDFMPEVDKIFDEFVSVGGAQKTSDLLIYSSIMRELAPKNVLEFATAEGLTTSVLIKTMNMHSGNSKLLAFDYDDYHVNKSRAMVSKYDLTNVKMIKHSYFEQLNVESTFDVVFIDGFHAKKDGEAIIKMIQPLLSDNFVLFVHDIGWDASSSNDYGIISPYDEWTAWSDLAKQNGLNVFLTAKLMKHSKYANHSWRSSRALLDSPAGVYTGHSMIISNYVEIK
jgi:predicted O-methyltransferase YrrM